MNECQIPIRNLVTNPSFETSGLKLARNCGRLRATWVLGACLILFIGLYFAYLITKKQREDHLADPTTTKNTVVVPAWLCFLPLGFAAYTYLYAVKAAEDMWEQEKIYFTTSGMKAEEYLNFRAGDDRLKKTGGLNFMNTIVLAFSGLFGKWLRGESNA
jgi:hypothetical protein